MKSISEIRLAEILPASIKNDAKIKALANALDAELRKLSSQLNLPLHLPRLNQLPHKVLDALAEMYNVIFYQPDNMTAETKRKLIRQALLDHKINGTKGAVENMLNRLTRGATVSEWFEAGYKNPRPYFFKLNLKGLQDYDDDGELFMKIVEATKNLRSHLDAVDFDLSKDPPDEILHVALIQLFLGNLLYELNTRLDDSQKFQVWAAEIFHGSNFFAPSYNNSHNFATRAGFLNITHGNIKFACESDESLDWYNLWLLWIRQKWRIWQPAKIYWLDDDDEQDDPEPEFITGNFLRLYINYHNSDFTRRLTIYDPRADLTASDIKSVNVDGLFIKRKKYLSNKIIRATYCTQTKITVL